jgi:hypothetical protein
MVTRTVEAMRTRRQPEKIQSGTYPVCNLGDNLRFEKRSSGYPLAPSNARLRKF